MVKMTVRNVNLTFEKGENSSFVRIALSYWSRNRSSNMYRKVLYSLLFSLLLQTPHKSNGRKERYLWLSFKEETQYIMGAKARWDECEVIVHLE